MASSNETAARQLGHQQARQRARQPPWTGFYSTRALAATEFSGGGTRTPPTRAPARAGVNLTDRTPRVDGQQTIWLDESLGMDSDVCKSELSVFVSAKNVNIDIRIRIRF
jgi:hypothetical protein